MKMIAILVLSLLCISTPIFATTGCCLPEIYQVNITLFSNSPRHIANWRLLLSTDTTIPVTRIDYWGNFTGNGIEQISLWDIYTQNIMYVYHHRENTCTVSTPPDFDYICISEDYDWTFQYKTNVLGRSCDKWTTDSISNGTSEMVLFNDPSMCMPVFYRYYSDCFLIEEWDAWVPQIPDYTIFNVPEICTNQTVFKKNVLDVYQGMIMNSHQLRNPSC